MRHVINFFVTGGLVWIFQLIGWIAIQADIAPFANIAANQLLVAAIVGLIFTIGMWVLNLIYTLLVFASCGIGCLFYPVKLLFVGPAGFYAVMMVLPGWVTMNANLWLVVLMGLIISIIRIPAIHTSTTSSSSSNR